MTPTVVICAYTLERWDALKEAVDSCRRQTLPCGEIILVIDYNEELEDRSRSEFPDVRVLANHLTKGLSGARNTGVLASTGDVIVFLDDDAYAEETCTILAGSPRPLIKTGIAPGSAMCPSARAAASRARG